MKIYIEYITFYVLIFFFFFEFYADYCWLLFFYFSVERLEKSLNYISIKFYKIYHFVFE